jgi:hypothetical protein
MPLLPTAFVLRQQWMKQRWKGKATIVSCQIIYFPNWKEMVFKSMIFSHDQCQSTLSSNTKLISRWLMMTPMHFRSFSTVLLLSSDLNISTHLRQWIFRSQISLSKPLTREILNTINLTCYTYWKCNWGPGVCLDWWEVCDGVIDCLGDGEDEMNCSEVEMNECAQGEYHCHNGGMQCIPEKFFRDNFLISDYLDGTDQYWSVGNCVIEPSSFECEESNIAHLKAHVVCGNGVRVFHAYDSPVTPLPSCDNQRDLLTIGNLYSHEANAHLSYACF